MNLAELPETTKLYQLLDKCQVNHELAMTEHVDGALTFTCFECPFWHVMDSVEENFFRDHLDILAQKHAA